MNLRRIWFHLFFGAVVFASNFLVTAALSQSEIDASPILVLDTGGHLATVNDIAFTSKGDRLVTVGNDKTIRVTQVSTGQTRTVIRGQIGDGREGQIYALAVSPDDTSVSVGGWFGGNDAFQPCCGDIRHFDLRSGKLLTVLTGHSAPVTSLAHSNAKEMLLSGSSSGELFAWQKFTDEKSASGSIGNGEREVEIIDTPKKLLQGLAPIVKVGFLENGKIAVAIARNGEIVFFDLELGKKIRSVFATEGQLIAADIGHKGSLVAVADQNAVVSTWSPSSDAAMTRLETARFVPGSITLYDEDTKLLVTCGFGCSGVNEQHLWDLSAAELESIYAGHNNTVRASTLSPDGLTFATAGGERNEIHFWQPGLTSPVAKVIGLGAPVWAVSYQPDARLISWGISDPCPQEVYCPERIRALELGLRLPEPGDWLEDPIPASTYGVTSVSPETERDQWRLQAERSGRYNLPGALLKVLKSNRQTAVLEKDATNGWAHSTFSMSQSEPVFFTGDYTGEAAKHQLADGRLTTSFVGGHDDMILSIDDNADENILLTGGRDQRIAIWNRESGELIANLFHASDGNWIIWIPQGYYYSSPDGDRFVGWHVNQGKHREARYLTARQLRRHLFSPEIIRRALELKSARQAVEELRPTDTRLAQLLKKPAPAFSVELAENDDTVPDGYARLRIRWETANGRTGEEVQIFSNNRHIETASARSLSGSDGSGLVATYDVKLEPGDNAINVHVSNEFGFVTERGAFSFLEDSPHDDRKGRLFVIAVGVNEYPLMLNLCNGPGGSCDLKYAVKDASTFLQTVIDRVGNQYASSSQLNLVNGGELEPTAANIQDEIEYFLEEPSDEDMTLIFFAGHGVNLGEEYYFVPTDGERRSEDRWRTRSLVSWQFLREVLEYTKGTRLLFLDTCHSGNAYNSRLVKDTADARVVVFSAAKSNQYALETSEKKHGLFTYSLINGLKGEADLYKDQSIRLLELATYVSAHVNQLSNNRQSPEYYLSGLDDFLLTKW
ncbi:caspase family protein [Roseibium sp. SCP14]|uniref:caspase family protein n=1 Tax=Roseibium sp. SCP14 TaxID=3141375 RepID=UPI0033377C05